MCGRVACNQCREVYQKATSYYNEKTGEYILPKWNHVSNNGLEFQPSCNIAPTEVTPILLSGDPVSSDCINRILQPMMWGVIPPWHKGSYKSHGLSTNNCRIENLGSSKLYGPLLKEGKRCVVICDGFYEWQTTIKSNKQPYFIYSKQDSKFAVEDKLSWLEGEWTSETGWTGPNLLYMAGLFNVWKGSEGEEISCYTVITRESNKEFSWLHHRVPAILSEPQQLQSWLDVKSVNLYEALKVLEPVQESLAWHTVSTLVNKSSNKSSDCNKKIQIKKSTLLTSWLKKEQPVKRECEPNSSSTSTAVQTIKKLKKEEDSI